ncbi:MAG: hypothetical protein U0165_12345 [Polyangiaceae bacterium]
MLVWLGAGSAFAAAVLAGFSETATVAGAATSGALELECFLPSRMPWSLALALGVSASAMLHGAALRREAHDLCHPTTSEEDLPMTPFRDQVPAPRPSGSEPTEIMLWRGSVTSFLLGPMIAFPGVYMLALALASGAWVCVPPAIGWVALGMFVMLARSGVRLDPVTQEAVVWRGPFFPLVRRFESLAGARNVVVRRVTAGQTARHEVHVERELNGSSHLESFAEENEATQFACELRRFLGM